MGYGPIDRLLRDGGVEEIMVNGPRQVWVVRRTPAGVRMELSEVVFEDDDHVRHVAERIFGSVGRRIDESTPMQNARIELESGETARANAVLPPLAVDGPAMTIRMHRNDNFTLETLVARGTLGEDTATFLAACVRARMNILVSGGTGSGKTTVLNALAASIGEQERIITIEDSVELRLNRPHVLRLEARPPNIEGRGEVTIRQLLINALRMRPDRIVVGEVRGGEALDMLQAMNTGHDGSLSTIHANDASEAVFRLETMVLQGGVTLPSRAVRQQIAGAIDVLVHQVRLPGGARRVATIAEVVGMSGEDVETRDIFSVGDDIEAPLRWTGYRPRLVDGPRFAAYGAFLPRILRR
jgi:pilus assembly protein CpaF